MSPGLWESIQEDLRGKIDKESFEAWFGKVDVEERKNNLIIWVPTLFHKDWIDNHYKEGIVTSATKFMGHTVKVKVMCQVDESNLKGQKQTRRRGRRAKRIPPEASFLNPLYTFDAFVVGESNQYANAACLAVAESLSRIYNPLFIYSRPGLGKTHLMQAIGHQVIQNNPETKVIFTNAENFTNEFINSIRDGRTDAFHKKYRSCDLLLVDDIQFLANKQKSQEEFFHTFNELYESSRQLVIASDRPPKDIPTIDERLKTRLEWGLLADIQPPELEHRVAILRKKADEADTEVPEECIEYIATKITTSIRELEGALLRVIARASFTKSEITLDQTQDALKDLTESHRDTRVSVDEIQKAVSEYFKVTTQELKGKRRSSDVTLPRQVAMFLCRQITGMSLPVIGSEFGGRDHTTVLHSCKKIGGLVESDRHMQDTLSEIKATLQK
ncbi:MAG: chromosomal replication initiator protein DnaA [Candidatus Lindowbacteria bacterium]|nr:chromosomal replication initiator protein DnaA [Candidatus Lindowbacteria bacterium]